MTADHIRTVQSSWAKVRPVKNVAAQLFAERLIDADPSFPCVSPGDTRRQGAKLMQVIDAVAIGLGRLDGNAALAQRASRRYAGCDLSDRQVETAGAALIWTLEKCLGTGFTPEMNDAWATVYAELVASMRNASFVARLGDASPARETGLGNAA